MAGRGVTIKWDASAATAATRRGALRGLRRAADLVAEEADRRAPRDSGELIESRQIKIDESKLTAEISYGGQGGLPQAYAIRQHEDLELQHPSGGEAKYLENAVEKHKMDFPQIMADEIRAELH